MTTKTNRTYYFSKLVKYDLGYRIKTKTKNLKLCEIWMNKKSVNKIVEKLNNGIFQPGFDKNKYSSYSYEFVEVTPKKVLRFLKLKKIAKKINQM